jgi:hypothetical protein
MAIVKSSELVLSDETGDCCTLPLRYSVLNYISVSTKDHVYGHHYINEYFNMIMLLRACISCNKAIYSP